MSYIYIFFYNEGTNAAPTHQINLCYLQPKCKIRRNGVAKKPNIHYQTIGRKLGPQKKLDVWVPYELTQKNLFDHIFI